MHFDIPNLTYFEYQNIYTASQGDFRFRVYRDGDRLHVQTYRFYCFEKAQVEQEADFAFSEEGRGTLDAWLVEQCR